MPAISVENRLQNWQIIIPYIELILTNINHTQRCVNVDIDVQGLLNQSASF